jgi:hypothetical protein
MIIIIIIIIMPSSFYNDHLYRSAFIGLCASSLSDICSNSLRVLKTAKQTIQSSSKSSSSMTSNTDELQKKIGYITIARQIIEEDGLKGLLGRGLQV